MADPCCERIIGGLVYFSVGDARFEATGDVTIEPATVERTGEATAGGRTYVTEKAKPARFSCDFANICGNADPMILWDARCNVNITVVEHSRDIRHLFTNTTVVGTPSINLSTGIVAGLQGVTDQYLRT
jgi:hypothetical protein